MLFPESLLMAAPVRSVLITWAGSGQPVGPCLTDVWTTVLWGWTIRHSPFSTFASWATELVQTAKDVAEAGELSSVPWTDIKV